MEEADFKKYFIWGIIAIIIILSYLILKDFLVAIVSAFILAYLLKPVHTRLAKIMPNKLAAALTVTIAIIVVLLLFAFVITSLISQFGAIITDDHITKSIALLEDLFDTEIITENLSSILSEALNTLFTIVSKTVTKVPLMVLLTLVTFFITYYVLVDWDKIREKIINILPFKNNRQIFEKIELTTWQIAIVTLTVALIEAVLAIGGFWILGINYALFLGFLIALFAFIPMIGPMAIWLPVAIYEIIIGKYLVATGVIILGIALSTGIDFLLRAKLIGKKTSYHPALMLVGLLGGISVFGLIGIILGPLILGIMMTIVEEFNKTKKH